MTTPRDLLIVALDAAPGRPVEPGDLSLALAGAEVIDLLGARALTLGGDRIVPGHPSATGDRLLDEAASSPARQVPYESVDDWLWRRGRGLSAAYLAALRRTNSSPGDAAAGRCSGPAGWCRPIHRRAAGRRTGGRRTSPSWPPWRRRSASAAGAR